LQQYCSDSSCASVSNHSTALAHLAVIVAFAAAANLAAAAAAATRAIPHSSTDALIKVTWNGSTFVVVVFVARVATCLFNISATVLAFLLSAFPSAWLFLPIAEVGVVASMYAMTVAAVA